MFDQPEQSVSPFDQIKQVDDEGNEFWSARDMAKILGYSEYGRFQNTLNKAEIACENSGYNSEEHFDHTVEMVEIGSKAKREFETVRLSRYACYLVVQNADPAKEIVALGQTYFAVQTRRQELSGQSILPQNEQRLMLRSRIKRQNSELASAAKHAGVNSEIVG